LTNPKNKLQGPGEAGSRKVVEAPGLDHGEEGAPATPGQGGEVGQQVHRQKETGQVLIFVSLSFFFSLLLNKKLSALN
jgi:hypothetical protein